MPTNNSWNSQDPAQVALGGTGVASFNADGVVISNTTTTGALASLALTNGQIVIGATSAAPAAATLTAGTGVSIANSTNSITISATGVGSTVVVTTTTQAMTTNVSYIANDASLVTLTLPTTSAVGDEMTIMYQGAGGWKIAQNAGQSIIFGTSTTTSGTGGSLASSAVGDCVTIRCQVANTTFIVVGSQGNLSVV